MIDADPAESAAEPAEGRSPTVLTIDDSATARQLIAMAMRRRPHVTVLMASNGSDGVRIASEQQPAMILLDGYLPDMSGLDVLRSLKALPATREIPVVMLSGETRDQFDDASRAAGAAEYIVKPVDLAHLYELVDRYAPESGATRPR